MRIQSINSVYKCIDGYKQVVNTYKLNNGNTLKVFTEYKNDIKKTSLQYLLDNTGNWIKSKLRYFDDKGKCFNILKSQKR